MLWTQGLARRNALVVSATVSALFLLLSFRQKAHPHEIQILQGMPSTTMSLKQHSEIVTMCRTHGFEPYAIQKDRPRKVYDMFLFSHEMDWLEIRLNSMAPYVDYFIIVESPTTFTGLEKPLFLKENWANFTKFHTKIIHNVVEDPGAILGKTTWAHEDYFRGSLFHSSFPTLVGTEKQANEGDVLLLSDVDEIPKPQAMEVLRHCEFPDRLTLRSHFYYYSFQWLHTGEQWSHPQATVFHGLENTLSPSHLRSGIGGPGSWIPFRSALQRWRQSTDLWNAAWHCSSCFATMAEMRSKMESFSHTPLNTEENRDEATMLNRVRHGEDLFGRKSQRYQRVENNQDVPPFILEHKDQYRYLLDRDGEDAGFRDWQRPAE